VVEPVEEKTPEPFPERRPAQVAARVEGGDERAARQGESGDADRRGHRLVQVQDVELLCGESAADTADGARAENDVRQ
jgi:hypothetical protein